LVGDFVPEAARLRLVKMDRKLTERKAVIRYSEWDEGTQGRVELEDITLKW
jgi:hypothetical protein